MTADGLYPEPEPIQRIGWLVAYWALGRDPTPRDQRFLERFAYAFSNSSIPEAAAETAKGILESEGA